MFSRFSLARRNICSFAVSILKNSVLIKILFDRCSAQRLYCFNRSIITTYLTVLCFNFSTTSGINDKKDRGRLTLGTWLQPHWEPVPIKPEPFQNIHNQRLQKQSIGQQSRNRIKVRRPDLWIKIRFYSQRVVTLHSQHSNTLGS